MRFPTRRLFVIMLTATICSLQWGCWEVHRYDVLMHPKSPTVIGQVSNGQALVYVYQESTNSLVEYGWIDIEKGMTLSHFDWAAYIEKRARE